MKEYKLTQTEEMKQEISKLYENPKPRNRKERREYKKKHKKEWGN